MYRALTVDSAVTVEWAWWNDTAGAVTAADGARLRKRYDCIGFSVAYEPLYFTVVRALLNLGIEPARAHRKADDPAVIIGGAAATMNPTVAGAIADAVFAGEADGGNIRSLPEYITERIRGAAGQLTPMTGIVIPGHCTVAPRSILTPGQIDSSFLPVFDEPEGSVFGDAGLVEIGRGCGRGCRFCAAGHICLPVRHRPVEDILRDVDTYTGHTTRIGLVGASISDHPRLADILRGIIDRGFGLTTSSFRADMIDDEIAGLLHRGGLRTVTIAPEGGSERIRRIMNKRLSEDAILRAATSCRHAGIQRLKLYYMIGLPWEREEDIVEIIRLTGTIRAEFGGQVSVSVNPFIPKPQTPFQWCAMADEKYIAGVYRRLENRFRRMKGVALKTMSARIAIREAVLSLGDEKVGDAVITSVRDDVPWKKALKLAGVDVFELLHTGKPADYRFPWDCFLSEKTKTALYRSFKQAESAAEIR